MQAVVPSSEIKAVFYHVDGINASKYVPQIHPMLNLYLSACVHLESRSRELTFIVSLSLSDQ